jgi:PIN domain nuclease of toxin-antitoxin system
MAAIQDVGNEVCVSPASHWEIAIRISLGKYRLREGFATFWDTGMQAPGFRMRPINIRDTARLISLPFHHKDPFDRLLISQSLVNDLALVSADAVFDAYGINRVWQSGNASTNR